jgi:aminoglycoside phosphotransferase (APT) family kinase protein
MGERESVDDQGLDPEVLRWAGDVIGGEIVAVRRFVHARPMWELDAVRTDGERVDLFLRGDRGPGSALAPVYDLAREADVVRALSAAGIPTPAFVGYHVERRALLVERVDGRSDVHLVEDARQRQRVGDHLMQLLADLHALDPSDLDLDLPVPASPAEHALQELDIAEDLYRRTGLPGEPTMTLGARWLRRHVPRSVHRTSLVQGDTGPGNFLFAGDEVRWLVDWELAHFGDPVEDLAAVCVRDMVTPFADLPALFERYAEISGTPVEPERIHFHRVSKCVRSLVALLSYTERAAPSLEYNTWQGWRALYLRNACQAFAEAMGVDVSFDVADSLGADGGASPRGALYGALRAELAGPIAAGVTDPLLAVRLRNSVALVEVLARFDQLGAAVESAERTELGALLGHEVDEVASGIAELDARIAGDDIGDDVVLRYLARRAARGVELYRPVMGELADRWFAPFAR